MKIPTRRHMAGIALAFLIAGSAFGQGLYWEATTTGGPVGEKPSMSQNYAMPKMFKIVSPDRIMILRLDQEKVYNIEPANKTYSEMTFAQIEELAKKAEDRMAQFREKIKNMPPEQQKQMEAMTSMLGKAAEAKIEVSSTGDTKTVSGFPCTKYVLTRGGKEMTTLWVTKAVSGFENIRKDWVEFGKRMASLTNMSGLATAYTKIDGFPMETDMDMMGKMTAVVTKVEKRSTPASEFNVPAGFTKKEPEFGKTGK